MNLAPEVLAEEGRNHCLPVLAPQHPKTWIQLDLPETKRFLSLNEVAALQPKLTALYSQIQAQAVMDQGLGKDVSDLVGTVNKLNALQSGEDWTWLTDTQAWLPIALLPRMYLDPSTWIPALLAGNEQLTNSDRQKLRVENAYEALKPFTLAIGICLLAFLVSLVGLRSSTARARPWTLILMVVLLAWEIVGVAMRSYVSGRAPVTNMFETVMWCGLTALFLSFLLFWRLKNPAVAAVGLAVNGLTLFMMQFSTSMLDGRLRPLVPVLRDNFWLSTHVTTVTFAYGCFTLSWMCANAALIQGLFHSRTISTSTVESWNRLIRLIIQIGTVFLAAGVILGGIWADYSWGRFWGWDPKETWSLIALVGYLILLHGRYVGWFRHLTFVRLSALAYLLVIMAWFGVNYVLAAGLHSYGFSSGGGLFVISLILLQLGLLGAHHLKYTFLNSR
jgi:ABC-type transport system involved in cytochrome c biogenesis permease subunit